MTTGPTEPGGTGRFLAAVHRLRTDVERKVADLSEDVTERMAAVATRVDALQEALAELQHGKKSETPRTPDWPTLREEDPSEHDRLWAEMTQWAGTVLPRYSAVRERLPSCWTQHPDAIDVITAAWTAWRGAYGPKARPTDALTWHRDARPLIERQLAETWPGMTHDLRCHVHDPLRRTAPP